MISFLLNHQTCHLADTVKDNLCLTITVDRTRKEHAASLVILKPHVQLVPTTHCGEKILQRYVSKDKLTLVPSHIGGNIHFLHRKLIIDEREFLAGS